MRESKDIHHWLITSAFPCISLGDVLYLDYSPRRVVLAGWVGDQDPTFKGLENALKRYLKSAWAGNTTNNNNNNNNNNKSCYSQKCIFLWEQGFVIVVKLIQSFVFRLS